MTHIQFIAKYLAANPGATSATVRRALCSHLGREYRGNYLTWYFSPYYSGCVTKYKYWESRGKGWYLTEAGKAKAE